MTWEERIWNSDAGRANPERARKIIEEAGGHVPDSGGLSSGSEEKGWGLPASAGAGSGEV